MAGKMKWGRSCADCAHSHDKTCFLDKKSICDSFVVMCRSCAFFGKKVTCSITGEKVSMWTQTCDKGECKARKWDD